MSVSHGPRLWLSLKMAVTPVPERLSERMQERCDEERDGLCIMSVYSCLTTAQLRRCGVCGLRSPHPPDIPIIRDAPKSRSGGDVVHCNATSGASSRSADSRQLLELVQEKTPRDKVDIKIIGD
ncbi:hypothetical protein BX600DRAFT_71847 [Xylariales sp. PMI_506]|nr:hypothetical protein BX600DRAFT_71847 [Xylariales sp. PMI_506]